MQRNGDGEITCTGTQTVDKNDSNAMEFEKLSVSLETKSSCDEVQDSRFKIQDCRDEVQARSSQQHGELIYSSNGVGKGKVDINQAVNGGETSARTGGFSWGSFN